MLFIRSECYKMQNPESMMTDKRLFRELVLHFMRKFDFGEKFVDILAKRGKNYAIGCTKALENYIEQSSLEYNLKLLEEFKINSL